MNADDRAPAGESQQSFTPATGEAGVRRSGIMPASSSVPQRTAFRPVTGTHATSAQPGAAPAQSAPSQGARPASAPQPTGAQRTGAQPTGTQPTGTQTTGTQRSPFAPASDPSTSAPQPSRLPRPDAAPTTGTQPAGSDDAATRSVTASAGLGRLKSLGDKAKDKVTATDSAKAAAAVGPRRVRVLVSRLDPWSALKIGFLLSIAMGIMFVVAIHILWNVLNSMNTLDLINEWVQKLFTAEQEVNILQFLEYGKVMSAALLVAVTNVVLLSGLSVIGAFIYNLISRVVGGVYLTLTDD